MSDLLPCPFCGGEAGKIVDATRILGTFNLIHRCPVIGPFKIEHATQEAVIATWNTRAPSQAQEAALTDTTMSDLPERIWYIAYGDFRETPSVRADDVEYIRKDIADAAVRAERERCAVLIAKFDIPEQADALGIHFSRDAPSRVFAAAIRKGDQP